MLGLIPKNNKSAYNNCRRNRPLIETRTRGQKTPVQEWHGNFDPNRILSNFGLVYLKECFNCIKISFTFHFVRLIVPQ